jgi:hypothetical protein
MQGMLPPIRRAISKFNPPTGMSALDTGICTAHTWYSAHGEAGEYLFANPDCTHLTNMLLVMDHLRERMSKK